MEIAAEGDIDPFLVEVAKPGQPILVQIKIIILKEDERKVWIPFPERAYLLNQMFRRLETYLPFLI